MKQAEDVIQTVQQFAVSGLSVAASGNASVKTEQGFLITPTGIAYSAMLETDLVECDYTGKILSGERKPSSEWQFHSALYQARLECCAVVHVHSPYATALACLRQGIPAFHYMVARTGGDSILCADYATFGTEQLAINVVQAIEGRKACLMANHGLVTVGQSLAAAFTLALEVEEMAKQYVIASSIGEPVLLSDDEMQRNIEKFKTYGKQ